MTSPKLALVFRGHSPLVESSQEQLQLLRLWMACREMLANKRLAAAALLWRLAFLRQRLHPIHLALSVSFTQDEDRRQVDFHSAD